MKKVKIFKTNGEVEDICFSVKEVKTSAYFLIIKFENGDEFYYVLSNIFKFEKYT